MNAGLLLAQRDNWERLGDRFSGQNAEIDLHELGVLLLGLVAAGALIWLLHRLAKWQEGRALSHNPKRLFRDLCRSHRLSGWQVKVLRAVSEAVGLQEPAEVFVRPEALKVENLPDDWEKHRADVDSLRRRLFTELD